MDRVGTTSNFSSSPLKKLAVTVEKPLSEKEILFLSGGF
jgi:hypothetical protein